MRIAASTISNWRVAPFVFGKLWLRYPRNLGKDLPTPKFGLVFWLCSHIVCICIVNGLQHGMGVQTFMEGLALGLILGIGVVGTFTAGNAIYFGLPIKLWILDTSHHLMVLALASGTLALFK